MSIKYSIIWFTRARFTCHEYTKNYSMKTNCMNISFLIIVINQY